MPYKLRNLHIDRVDLVDKGANQHAHVLFYKRATPLPLTPAEVATRVARAESVLKDAVEQCGLDYMPGPAASYEDMLLRNTVHRLYSAIGDRYSALMDTIGSIVRSNDVDKQTLIRTAVKAFLAEMKATVPDDVDKRVATTLRGLDELRAFEGETSMPMTDVEKAAAEKAQTEAIQKAIDAALITQKAAFDAELAKRDAKIAEADAAVKKADEIAKAERDKREQREFADLAKTYAPVVQTDEAELLRKVAGAVDAETWTKLQTLFKRAVEQVRTSKLLANAGDDGHGEPAADSAEAEVLKRADKLVADGKAKSKAIAVDDVLLADAALSKRYADESAARVRAHGRTH